MSNVVFHKEFINILIGLAPHRYIAFSIHAQILPQETEGIEYFPTPSTHTLPQVTAKPIAIMPIIYSSAFSTLTINGPTLSPVSLLCATWEASHKGKVPDNQQRQYTFLSPAAIFSMVATLGDSSSILLLIRSWRRAVYYNNV